MAWSDQRLDDLANRFDSGFAQVNARIDGLDKKIDSKFAALDSKIDSSFGTLDSKIDSKVDGLRTELKGDIDKLDTKIDRLQYLIIYSAIGIVVSLIGVNATGLLGS